METRKNRSSIFDIFILSILGGLILSRIIYIVSNWSQYNYIWYWLPYERYGDEIDWFRLLPWRFFNIFDGGLDIFVMFVGFLLSANFWSSAVKKWDWNHTFPTIFFAGDTMLGLSFLLMGLSNETPLWIYEGLLLLITPIVSLIAIGYVNRIEKPQKEKKIYLLVNLISILVTTVGIGYVYLQGQINIYERVTVIIFLIWAGLGLIYFLRDLKKNNNIVIEKVSSVRSFDTKVSRK
jgi:prolipoprotein diacylglyceryltransferase